MTDTNDSTASTANFEHISLSASDRAVTITINRPKVLNALNVEVIEELEEALAAEIDPVETRVVVLEGAGSKAFVAGADIAQMTELNGEHAIQFSQHGQVLTRMLETLPFVTIAKVQGFALGGGCELALACDLIIAGESAKFGLPEVNLGLIPGFGGTQRLAHRVGLPVALDMVLCGRGRTLSGAEAVQLGLVSRLVADERLDEEVQKAVSAICQAGPSAVQEAKRLVRDSYAMGLEAGLASEASSFANCFGREEAREGMTAFLEKRAPNFQGND